MLTVLLNAMLLGSPAAEPLMRGLEAAEASIAERVHDEERRAAALLIIAETRAAVEDYERRNAEGTATLAGLLQDRGAAEADLRDALDALRQRSDRLDEKLVELRFRLIETVGAAR